MDVHSNQMQGLRKSCDEKPGEIQPHGEPQIFPHFRAEALVLVSSKLFSVDIRARNLSRKRNTSWMPTASRGATNRGDRNEKEQIQIL